MKTKLIACVIAGAFLMTPLVFGKGLLPLNPLVNGDFDTYVTPGMAQALRPVADRCFGIGHQVLDPLGSSWEHSTEDHVNAVGDELNAANQSAQGGNVTDAANHTQSAANLTAETDPNSTADYVGTYPELITGNPSYPYYCDPNYNEFAMLNAWNISRDRGLAWSSEKVTFTDNNGDGDQEAVFNTTPGAFLYQAAASTQQAWSADFDSFEFTLESGNLPPGAYIQIGFSVVPGYQQNPFIGVWWDGIQFNKKNMTLDEQGRIHLNPIKDGFIVCAVYTPCTDFQKAYSVGDEKAKHNLLGQVRLVQTSFWGFGNPSGHVVIDDVAYVGAKTMAETVPNLNPMNVL
ncbi:MAG: hypothetical protein WDA16_11845 [Candidatus Thermoplasmatota archaeon]